MNRSVRTLLSLVTVLLISPGSLFAQSESAEQMPSSIDVFLDCGGRLCDFNYLRREIPYVNYVRERTEADVHLLVTSEQTGSGGRAYRLNFIGLRNFRAVGDTLLYTASGTDTDDERRSGLARKIKLGLVPYLKQTPMADFLDVRLTRAPEEEQHTNNPENDPWNSWVFGIQMNGNFNAEQSSDNLNMSGRFYANRITEEWKFQSRVNLNYRERNFDVGDETISSVTEDGSVWLYLVNSIAEKWSVGFSSYTDTSTRQNRKLSSSLSPAVEYSFFPYSESSERAITAVYQLGFQAVEYKELTVFDKSKEKLLQQSLRLNLDYRQPWGTAHAEVRGSNYLTDFESTRTKYYRVELGGSVSVRLVRGLNVNFGFGYDVVKDQLYLVKEGLTEEEILLGTKRLPTSYEYNVQMGFSYNFGSIYNNVVNTRL
jgi:hypothetical protein